MVNCRENIALCGKHKLIDGQTTSTMYVYHCGSHDRNVQKFEHQRDMACQFYSGSAVQEKWIKTLEKMKHVHDNHNNKKWRKEHTVPRPARETGGGSF